MTKSIRERATVNPGTGCWEWIHRKDRKGYGRTTWQGRKGYLAHRASYEEHVGPIPEGVTVDHLCFNPACVNPDHLRLLSRRENASNQRSALRTHCPAGHAYSEENTYIKPAGRREGRRTCRTCNAASQRARRARARRARQDAA